MKGIIEVKQADGPKFRVACHFSKVNFEEMGEPIGEQFNVMVSCSDIMSIYRLGKLMTTITQDQVNAFNEHAIALQKLDQMRREML